MVHLTRWSAMALCMALMTARGADSAPHLRGLQEPSATKVLMQVGKPLHATRESIPLYEHTRRRHGKKHAATTVTSKSISMGMAEQAATTSPPSKGQPGATTAPVDLGDSPAAAKPVIMIDPRAVQRDPVSYGVVEASATPAASATPSATKAPIATTTALPASTTLPPKPTPSATIPLNDSPAAAKPISDIDASIIQLDPHSYGFDSPTTAPSAGAKPANTTPAPVATKAPIATTKVPTPAPSTPTKGAIVVDLGDSPAAAKPINMIDPKAVALDPKSYGVASTTAAPIPVVTKAPASTTASVATKEPAAATTAPAVTKAPAPVVTKAPAPAVTTAPGATTAPAATKAPSTTAATTPTPKPTPMGTREFKIVRIDQHTYMFDP